MTNYVCIHGHFYQPPRENAWLETVEIQDSAYPYHDWNERVTAECYAPNAASRVLDTEGFISAIGNNYSRISFNFGPTLLSWLESEMPDLYASIIEADEAGRQRYSGHGTAIAQVYNHMIMPLANARDRRTQVVWGIQDFEQRFGRSPEGMWLAETAVDRETLEDLAAQGIKFTILAPAQASRVRPLSGGQWTDVSGARIDPTRPYLQRLPSGASIALFFYDGPISQAVAFERLLDDGAAFARRMTDAISPERDWPQLIHIATDGESYGHHHRHGDMALAALINEIDSGDDATLTVYGEYLEKHPPSCEVEIFESTSWSCAHGVERWRSDCGDNSGGQPGWNQSWRTPLRASFDWLRDQVSGPWEAAASQVFSDPWNARDQYIAVVLDRSQESVSRFLESQASRALAEQEVVGALQLMELQRHAMLMYTSCAWFFDDLSGIETTQVMQYAQRVLQLAGSALGMDLYPEFRGRIAEARSNLSENGDGGEILDKWIRPAEVSLLTLGAHYAMSSLFKEYEEETEIFSYRVESLSHRVMVLGRAQSAVGTCRVKSLITREQSEMIYAAVYPGDHNVRVGVSGRNGEAALAELTAAVHGKFADADFPGLLNVIDRNFGDSVYTLASLFRDDRRTILWEILRPSLERAEAAYSSVYETDAPIVRTLVMMNSPVPIALQTAAGYFFNRQIRELLASPDELDPVRLRAVLAEANAVKAEIDTEGIGLQFSNLLIDLADGLVENPGNLGLLKTIGDCIGIAQSSHLSLDLWGLQNRIYGLAGAIRDELAKIPDEDERAGGLRVLSEVATTLSVRA